MELMSQMLLARHHPCNRDFTLGQIQHSELGGNIDEDMSYSPITLSQSLEQCKGIRKLHACGRNMQMQSCGSVALRQQHMSLVYTRDT